MRTLTVERWSLIVVAAMAPMLLLLFFPDPLSAVFWLTVAGYAFLQVVALIRARGKWRLLVGAPLIVMLPVYVITVRAAALGSNLAHFPLLLTSPPAFISMIVTVVYLDRARRVPASARA